MTGGRKGADGSRGRISVVWAFVGVFALTDLALLVLGDRGGMVALQESAALQAGLVLQWIGRHPTVVGTSIVVGRGTVEVTPACLPGTALALGAALLSITSAVAIRSRIAWAAALAASLWAANILRLVIVGALADTAHPWLSVVHTVVAPAALLVIPLAVWRVAVAQAGDGRG